LIIINYKLITDRRAYNGTQGKNVTFTTTIEAASFPFLSVVWSVTGFGHIISWTPRNTMLVPKYADRITFYEDTGSLEVSNLTMEDSGEYHLLILLTAGHPMSGEAVLEVHRE